MRRALCPVETLYVAQRSRAVLSTTVRGDLDTRALAAAFDTVIQARPTLRTRIVPDGAGYALELLADQDRPRMTFRTGGDEVYEEELNTPLPVGGPLTRAVLVSAPDGDRHTLVLSVDHTVTDGHSAIALQNTVWDHYRDLVAGTAQPQASAAGGVESAAAEAGRVVWPTPVSELLPHGDPEETAKYLRRRTEEVSAHPVELLAYDTTATTAGPDTRPDTTGPADSDSKADTGSATGPADAAGRIGVARLTLDTDRTAALRRTARAAGVSVHGLVGAAVLTAARGRLAGTGPRLLGCMSPVDVRSRLSPPVPASVMVAAVTSHLQTVEVAADTDPLELAREVGGTLRDFVARGEYAQEMRIMPEVAHNPALQLGTVIVTNMGAVPGPDLPAGLRLEDVRLLPAREHYFPRAGRSPVMACVVSFEGRLAIEFPHHTACFSPSFMRGFRDDVRAVLLAFAESADAESVVTSTA